MPYSDVSEDSRSTLIYIYKINKKIITKDLHFFSPHHSHILELIISLVLSRSRRMKGLEGQRDGFLDFCSLST